MTKPARGPQGRRRAAAVRAAATKALAALLQPLAGFVLDSGLSVRELETLFRTAAVLAVAQRQRASHQRVNISGIAATTGIPRAEISQILRAPKRQTKPKRSTQTPINRILAAWHEEPGYQQPNGKPADLKVFGAAPSFESLVKKHGGGLPARAVLDELTRLGVSTTASGQIVGISKPAAREFGSNPSVIVGVRSFVGKRNHHSSVVRCWCSPELSAIIKQLPELVGQSILNAGAHGAPSTTDAGKACFWVLLSLGYAGPTNQKKAKELISRNNLSRSAPIAAQ